MGFSILLADGGGGGGVGAGQCFHGSSTVKNPPTTQETLVQFLSWEDFLEKGKATHSSVLA